MEEGKSVIDQAIFRNLIKEFGVPSALVYDSRLLNHDQLVQRDGVHPENPLRIYKIYKILKDYGLLAKLKRIHCREVDDYEIMFYHSPKHVQFMIETENYGKKRLHELARDGDSVYYNNSTHFCARLSCGGVIELLKAVALGNVKNGIAVVRPPGHHAVKDESQGFCFFNNVVIGVEKLIRTYGVKKVLILDWDVHHGNGIEDAFLESKDVLYISLHRYDPINNFYPGSGDPSEIGKGEGLGKNVNIAFTQLNMGDADYLYAFNKVVMPIAHEFAPDLVVISAGFDAAKDDPIGGFSLTPNGYAHMTYLLKGLAKGKLAVCLEGGYNPDVIAKSALAVVKVLLGGKPKDIENTKPSEFAKQDVHKTLIEHLPYWKKLKDVAKIMNIEVDNNK